MQPNPLCDEYIQQILFRFNENTPRIETCLSQLSEAQLWQRPNAASNSVGNLLLHLCGNITQYVIASLGHQTDTRNRNAEFAATEGATKAELWHQLTTTVTTASAIIRSLDETELLRVRMVQGFELSGIGITLHVTEHYSYHTGQIAFWTKLLTSQDLGFYAHMDLNQKNAS